MNLDDMQRVWAEQDRRLEQSLRLNRELLRETQLCAARSALGRLSWGLGLEFALDALLVLWLGSRLGEEWGAARFLVPTALCFLAWTVFLALALRQLALNGRIDYGAPIATVQRQVEELRLARLRSTQLRLLLAPLLWAPVLIVVLHACFGVDAWLEPGPGWLACNAGVGLACVPLLLLLARRLARHPGRHPRLERFLESLSGTCIARAEQRLAALAEFEREPC